METRKNVNLQGFAEKVQLPAKNPDGQGKILRLKQGYNPNSSSVGSVIFVLPAALLGITASFGAVSGIIMSTLMKSDLKNTTKTDNPVEGGVDE